MKWFEGFSRDEQGQDLIEYPPLLAFVSPASVAVHRRGPRHSRNLDSREFPSSAPPTPRRVRLRGCYRPLIRLTGRKVDMRRIAEFLQGEQGQDLVEYTLLLAFVMMAAAAMYINAGGSVSGIWTTTNTKLNSGIVAAGS